MHNRYCGNVVCYVYLTFLEGVSFVDFVYQ